MSTEQDPSWESLRAVIVEVYDTYVLTHALQNCGDLMTTESVTFSRTEWKGKSDPEAGQIVDLEETYLYARGWRAKYAHPVTPQTRRNQHCKQQARRA